MINVIRSVYHYQVWANERLFTAAARLSPEQWCAPNHPSHRSLRDIMIHLIDCEEGWIHDVQGKEGTYVTPDDEASVASLHQAWKAVSLRTQQYIQSLDNEGLARSVPWTDLEGETHDYPLWQLLLHQANHATQHRSEAALLLTQLGASTDLLDYLLFVNQVERPWQSSPPPSS